MNKNRLAIQNFFRYYRPENETHELAIRHFCAMHHVLVSFDGSEDERTPVTFDFFKRWAGLDTPCRGEIVVLTEEGVTGIVEFVGLSYKVRLYVSYRNGELDISPREYTYRTLRRATEEEVVHMQRAFNARGLSWNLWRSRIKPREKPVDNVQYQVSVLGRKVGFGIFREIDAAGNIVMYCFKPEGEPVRHSLHEIIGPESDYQLEKINVGQRESLAAELQDAGMIWNGFYKRVEPLGYRRAAGGEYYYLNELWEVCRTVEHERTKDQRYFNQGNYFRTREEANSFREYLRKMVHSITERKEASTYNYLKEFWKVCSTTDKGRSKDLKRAARGNYFFSAEEALRVSLCLQQKRNEQLAVYLPHKQHRKGKKSV